MPVTPPTPIGCEPLRVWNRLEGRARAVEFDRALAARVHDPLWLLARQWQFGEFKGEDTGSAVLAKLARRTAAVDAVQAGGAGFEDYAGELALETRVESLPVDFPPVARARLGRQFLLRLDAAADAATLPAGAAPYDPEHYRELFRREFPLAELSLDPADPADALAVARQRSEAAARRMKLALAGRAVDGVALWEELSEGMSWADLPGDLAIDVLKGHDGLVLGALEDYRAWFAGLYAQPAQASAWAPAGLEYRFACTVPRDDDSALVLTSDEHSAGALDWYSFDIGPLLEQGGGGAEPELDVRSFIPTAAEFAGMPNPRWWQFENGQVDLGNIRADTTDVAKLVVAEFALLYGNNWHVVPYAQRCGTLAEIEGIVVSDVFGWRTSVRAATGSSGGVWTRWDFFSLSRRPTGDSAAALGQHLFLPPAAARVDEREPAEAVAFVRDETTNTVWAVETRVPDGLGGARDGAIAARQFSGALEQLEESLAGGPPQPAAAAAGATLRYRLGTTVPENWIPFLPVHKPHDTREIRLQRASMPRFFLGGAQPVRPVTSVLRPGLLPDDTQDAPYFVNEEEVSPAGVVVEGGLRRTRWLGGKTSVWHARRKRSGRGEGGSGLRFDVVEKTGEDA